MKMLLWLARCKKTDFVSMCDYMSRNTALKKLKFPYLKLKPNPVTTFKNVFFEMMKHNQTIEKLALYMISLIPSVFVIFH